MKASVPVLFDEVNEVRNEQQATRQMNEGMKYEGRNETLNSFISFNPVNVNETNGGVKEA